MPAEVIPAIETAVVPPRHFPPPWTVDEINASVRDKNGQQLGYFYYEREPGRRTAANLLTKDEARRMAVNFAKLPDLPKQSKSPGAGLKT